jgi:predicted transcriptional regulator
MPHDARPTRRTSIFVIRASVEADSQFLARITVISDWMAASATPRAVADPEKVVRAVQAWLRDVISGEAEPPP